MSVFNPLKYILFRREELTSNVEHHNGTSRWVKMTGSAILTEQFKTVPLIKNLSLTSFNQVNSVNFS